MGTRTLILLMAGAGAGLTQVPTVADGGVLNGASFAKGQAVTPGSLISIFGSNLASHIAQADTIPLSNTLGGVSVQFVNGSTTLKAPMLYVSATQLNVQIPWELLPGGVAANVDVVVTNNGKSSAKSPFMAGPFSPGIFASGGRAIAANSADGTLAWPTGSVPGLVTHPAKQGDVIVIYATGLGSVAKPPADGENSLDKLRPTLVTPTVLVGGVSAQVLFSGLSPQFVGVNQVNVKVPSVAPGDAVTLQLQENGVSSQSNLTIAVSQ
jgi:uncharacterized protein (TIGR03437 family)